MILLDNFAFGKNSAYRRAHVWTKWMLLILYGMLLSSSRSQTHTYAEDLLSE